MSQAQTSEAAQKHFSELESSCDDKCIPCYCVTAVIGAWAVRGHMFRRPVWSHAPCTDAKHQLAEEEAYAAALMEHLYDPQLEFSEGCQEAQP